MKPIIFSEGFMQTTVNNQIMDTKKYKASYNGKDGEMIFEDNNKAYYIKADKEDIEKILNSSQDVKIDNELLKLKDSKHYTPSKKKTKKRRRKRRRYKRKKTPSRKKKSPTKKKTPSRKKKSPTKKKTKKSLLDDDFMKTLMP